MADENPQITIPANLDGLEQAAQKVLSGEEKLLDDVRQHLLHARIRHEYRLLKKKRGWGSGDQIRRELAEKYYNNPDRDRHIKRILYNKY